MALLFGNVHEDWEVGAMMNATTTSMMQREMIHWLWLWTLAAIIISFLQGTVPGQVADRSGAVAQHSASPQGLDESEPGKPIPMPNVDHPDWFHYPNPSPLPPGEAMSLSGLLQLHRTGDFERSLKGWQRVRMRAGSETWQQVGIGVALLRLDRLEEAMKHLELAVEQDASNAVAHYFMGRVRQAEGRQQPFWDESDQQGPFRLTSVVQPPRASAVNSLEPPNRPHPKMLLPHYIDDAYDRLARQHFRHAVTLAPNCDLNRVIHVVSDTPQLIQLASQRPDMAESITVGDLLDSLGERDYVRKAKAELGVRSAHRLGEEPSATATVPGGNWLAID